MAVNNIVKVIEMRHSCRSYIDSPLTESDRKNLSEIVSERVASPYGGCARFVLFAAEPSDGNALKKLGTYGFIRNPAAFIAGVIKEPEMNLEDFGYSMERIILHASAMGLGSCWLGGSFSRSGFAQRAGIAEGEIIPAVASIGYAAERKTVTDRILRAAAGSDKRKNRNELFFGSGSDELNISADSGYGRALEMVRLAPSASNKQPWRVVKEEGADIFHFFIERSPGYSMQVKFIGGTDLQRVDMGIAMCHFEYTALESGLKGVWVKRNPAGIKIRKGWEYCLTWDGE